MLRRNVAIVCPGLANAGPTMLRYIALKCCGHLAEASTDISNCTPKQVFLPKHRNIYFCKKMSVHTILK